MPEHPVTITMRAGAGPEHDLGSITYPAELPAFLRGVADEIEHQAAEPNREEVSP